MPHKIVVDKTNLIGNDNNTFVYRFPSSVAFPNHEIALASVDMYYAWYNVSAVLGNNTFSYVWVDGTTNTIVLEDGLYEINTINDRLQFAETSGGAGALEGAWEVEVKTCFIARIEAGKGEY